MRQERVVKALKDGFGELAFSVITMKRTVLVFVKNIEGFFEVDQVGDVINVPVGLPAELAYWIHTDLTCLDLMLEHEMIELNKADA